MVREEEREYIKKPPSYGKANFRYPVVSVRISRKFKMDIKHFKGSRTYREVILEGIKKFYQIEEEKERAYKDGYKQGYEDAKAELQGEEATEDNINAAEYIRKTLLGR